MSLKMENFRDKRGWVMRWDPQHESWVAENRSRGEHGLPAKGEPNTYGYDANGDLLPYANYWPPYAKGQVEKVWIRSRLSQLEEIDSGLLPLERPGDNQMWVRTRDNAPADGVVDLGEELGKWRLVEWEPGQPRAGKWDMGHVPRAKYSDIHKIYMNGRMSPGEFVEFYQEVANYQVEDPSRNRSHVDE